MEENDESAMCMAPLVHLEIVQQLDCVHLRSNVMICGTAAFYFMLWESQKQQQQQLFNLYFTHCE